ncbi:hypothetical protein AVEN_7736-1 [Araneus ventricosus]|uniref:Uncharacterized protein n=1 Tax=Araneus ventricosus TaxID=182803 RepID=A0A4Y2RTG4_ARAVE|nr:hypothetical protein AVEN_7736-1 [Araneus ventricosus]
MLYPGTTYPRYATVEKCSYRDITQWVKYRVVAIQVHQFRNSGVANAGKGKVGHDCSTLKRVSQMWEILTTLKLAETILDRGSILLGIRMEEAPMIAPHLQASAPHQLGNASDLTGPVSIIRIFSAIGFEHLTFQHRNGDLTIRRRERNILDGVQHYG